MGNKCRHCGFDISDDEQPKNANGMCIDYHAMCVSALAADSAAYEKAWRAEMHANLALRQAHGATENETFPAFVERLAAERDAYKDACITWEMDAAQAGALVLSHEGHIEKLDARIAELEANIYNGNEEDEVLAFAEDTMIKVATARYILKNYRVGGRPNKKE